ncbi:MAG: magnesium transporter [Gammaproteobacteria bacterium]|nr:magnesium transporter [Gammaproteobacteria bacterium]
MDQQQREQYHRSLEATLVEILELLEKHRLERELSLRQASGQRELVDALLARQHKGEFQRRLARMHPADIAFVLERLPTDERLELWALVDAERRGGVLLELADGVRDSLIAAMPQREIVDAAEHLESDEIAYLVPSLPQDTVAALLSSLDQRERHKVREMLAFPEGTVGALMDIEMVTVRDDVVIEVVLRYLRRHEELPDPFDQVFVVDRDGVLVGILRLKDLLTHDPDRPVAEVMLREPLTFSTHDPASDAVGVFERYDLVSAPVVNLHQRLTGVLHFAAVMDFISEQAESQQLKQVGLTEDEDLFAPVMDSARNRWPWLGLNLLTALVASRVIGAFEATIQQQVALAALMPVVASIGGNTGNQTVALVIRGMALEQIVASSLWVVVRKELAIALVNGLLWGSVVALAALLFYRQPALSLVMGIAVAANLLIASLAGVFIPVALKQAGRDPVLGSSVLLTFVTDAMGFLVFLGLAAWLIVG